MIRLPRLPAAWRYARIKEVAELRFSSVDKHSVPGELPVKLCNYVDVYRNEQITPGLSFMEATATASEVARFSVQPGDVLLTKDSETPNDIAVPACVAQPLQRVVCGYHLALLRPRHGMDGRFLHRALQASGIRDQFYAAAVGVTRYALGLGEVGNSRVPVPALTVQCAIADFLDRKASAIDALIAQKEQLAQVVMEKRIAEASAVLTRGLDPAARTKLCQHEWLGRIPSHWRVAPARWTTRKIQTGTTPPTSEDRYYENGTIPWYGPSSFSGALTVNRPVKCINPSALVEGKARLFKGGSTLVVTIGTVGKVGMLMEDGCANQQVTCLEFTETLHPRYAAYQLKRLEPVLRGIAPATTLPILNRSEVGSLPVLIPPIVEQQAIVEHLDRLDARTGLHIEALERSVEHLREYRQALITAAVTGQLDIAAQEAA